MRAHADPLASPLPEHPTLPTQTGCRARRLHRRYWGQPGGGLSQWEELLSSPVSLSAVSTGRHDGSAANVSVSP